MGKKIKTAPQPDDEKGVYANAMYDVAFKKIFQNKAVTMDLINGYITDRRVVDLKFTNTEILGESDKERRAVVDVICTDENGAEFVVEMQRASQQNFRERMIFYSSRIISENTEAKGFDWDFTIPKVYVLAFTAFSFTDVISDRTMNDVFALNYVTVEKMSGERMPHAPEYFFFDLHRFNKKIEEIVHSPEKWLYLLRNSSKLMTMPQEFKGDSAVEQYFTTSRISAFSDAEKTRYFLEQMNRWDLKNCEEFMKKKAREEGLAEGRAKGRAQGRAEGRAEGRKEGRAEGLAEGRAETNREVAKALLSEGVSLPVISRTTGLSERSIPMRPMRTAIRMRRPMS